MTTFQVSDKSLEKVNAKPLNPEKLSIYKHSKCTEVLQSCPLDNINGATFENGFVGGVFESYNNHHDLILRPDDVWISILTQFSSYVNANAEQLRKLFVTFDGKEQLVSFHAGVLRSAPYDEFAEAMVKQISEKIIDGAMANWIIPEFTTTTKTDKIAASIIMMSTMKKYFDYKCCLRCGIPNVKMLGTVNDWKNLRKRAAELVKYDNNSGLLIKWHAMLDPILENFVQSITDTPNIDWWNRITSYYRGGSGPSYLSGWISVFCVFDEDGKWLGDKLTVRSEGKMIETEWPVIDTNKIRPGFVMTPIDIDDNGQPHKAIMVAGHMGHQIIEETAIQPAVSWFIALTN